jgi:hypothetical protein
LVLKFAVVWKLTAAIVFILVLALATLVLRAVVNEVRLVGVFIPAATAEALDAMLALAMARLLELAEMAIYC